MKCVGLWFCFLCFSTLLTAATLNHAFDQAMLRTGQARQAQLKQLELRLKRAIKTEETAEKWFDLAVVFEAQGSLVWAYYSCEKALSLKPNLRVAQVKAKKLAEQLELQTPPKTAYQWVRRLPLAFYGAGLLLFYGAFLWAVKSGRPRFLQGGALFAGLLFASLLWAKPSWFGHSKRMMVMENLSAFEGPGVEYPASSPLLAGVVVQGTETQGGWVVASVGGQTRWVPLKKLAPL